MFTDARIATVKRIQQAFTNKVYVRTSLVILKEGSAA